MVDAFATSAINSIATPIKKAWTGFVRMNEYFVTLGLHQHLSMKCLGTASMGRGHTGRKTFLSNGDKNRAPA